MSAFGNFAYHSIGANMKRTMLLILILTGLAVAKQKPVYDLTGEITYHYDKPDSEAHVYAGGRHFDAYCNTSDTSISCSDRSGVFIVTFANGNWTPFGRSAADLLYSHCDAATFCDPLMEQMEGRTSVKFQYRVDGFKTANGPAPFFCVGFEVKDKHGKVKPQEACYEIIPSMVYPPK